MIICLSIYLSICLSVCLSVRLSVVYLSICLSVCLYIHLFTYLSTYKYIYIYNCVTLYNIQLFIHLCNYVFHILNIDMYPGTQCFHQASLSVLEVPSFPNAKCPSRRTTSLIRFTTFERRFHGMGRGSARFYQTIMEVS